MRRLWTILVLALVLTSTAWSQPPLTLPSSAPASSPMLTLTEAELQAILAQAVDEAVRGAVAITIREEERKVTLWRWIAITSTVLAAGAVTYAAFK